MINPSNTTLDPTAPTQTQDLLPWALTVLAMAEQQGYMALPASMMYKAVRRMVLVSPHDNSFTATDSRSRLDRSLLNLTSHNTLVRKGWAKTSRIGDPNTGPVQYSLTTLGRATLCDHFLPLLVELAAPNPVDAPPIEQTSQLYTMAMLSLAVAQLSETKGLSRDGWKAEVNRMATGVAEPLLPAVDKIVDSVVAASAEYGPDTAWVKESRSPGGQSQFIITEVGRAHVLEELLKSQVIPSMSFEALGMPSPIEAPTRRRRP